MPLFSYSAFDSKSKKITGFIDAHDAIEAKGKLREQGIMVVNISKKMGRLGVSKLSQEKLLSFTIQLNQLISANIPIYESLMTLEEQYRGDIFNRVILSLCEQIKSGSSLSQAMGSFPENFDQLYCSMISAGESAGALDIVLERLTELLVKQNKLRRDIFTAMIYPVILSVFSIVVIVLLLGFVVPSIEGIFEGRELNTFTLVVLKLSHIFRKFWWIYLPVISSVAGYLYWKLQTAQGKKTLEKLLMKIKPIRTLLVQAALTRYCRTLGTLFQGGLTIIDAMVIARNVMQNYTLEQDMKKAEKKIVEGSSLSIEFERSRWIPHMVSRMLAVAEESGTMDVMLNKIADIYEDNLEKTIERVMALAQPVILIFMGGIIGAVLLAVLLPLTDMSSFAM